MIQTNTGYYIAEIRFDGRLLRAVSKPSKNKKQIEDLEEKAESAIFLGKFKTFLLQAYAPHPYTTALSVVIFPDTKESQAFILPLKAN